MTHLERYKSVKEISLTEALPILRKHIGELEDLRQPTPEEVERAVEECFPELLSHEKAKLVDAFIKSEADAAAEADRLAEQ